MKRAYVEVDIAAVVIIIILFLLLFAALKFIGRTTYTLVEVEEKIGDDLTTSNILRAKIGDEPIYQTLIKDYLSNDFTKSKAKIDSLLEIKGKKLCWKLEIGDKIIRRRIDCVKGEETIIGSIDGKTIIPLIFNGKIETLVVRIKI